MARFVRRSWGWYFVLLNFRHFKVKLLRFSRGTSLSYQYHSYRSELWLFLSGVGMFTREISDFCCAGGDFAFVDIGDRHSFNASLPTWVIEIQYGKECNEEDIVRIKKQ